MASVAAGVAAVGVGARGVQAAAGEPLVVGQSNNGGGSSTRLVSAAPEPTLIVESGQEGIGGRGLALRVRGSLVTDGFISSRGQRGGISVTAYGTAISADTRGRYNKNSTIVANSRGGVAVEGRSEAKNWYGTGVYCRGQFVLQPGCGIAVVAKGDSFVDVTFD
jgi:hypothetical protein